MKKTSFISNILVLSAAMFFIVGTDTNHLIPVVRAVEPTGPTYTLLEPLPKISIDSSAYTMSPTVNLNTYLVDTINLLIALSAVAAVFMIVYGGLIYMTSESFGKKNDGLEKVKNAVVGLLMVLSTYIILKTVNPKLVAIPGTLVPPITGLVIATSSEFFTQLSADEKATTDAANAYTTNAQAAATAINDAQKKKDDLLNALKLVPVGDPQRTLIESELQATNNTIQQETITRVVNETQAGLLTSLASVQRQAISGTSNAQTMVTYQASVDDYYYQGLIGLQKAGIDTTKAENVQQLKDTKAYALGEIYMCTNYGGSNSSEASRISREVSAQYDLISDSNPYKAKLKSDLDKRLSALQ